MAHLTSEQRYTISVLLQQKKSLTFISTTIGKDKSVVSREIQRNSSPTKGTYIYEQAQTYSDERKKNKPHHRRLTPKIIHYIEDLIRQEYSPEQVVGRAKLESIPCVSITSIYKYIWDNKEQTSSKDKLFRYLRVGRKKEFKKCGKYSGLGVIPDRVMLSQRPKEVDKRERFGDFEADTVWIANKAVIVTVNDRTTGISHIRHLPDRKSERVNRAIADILEQYKGMVKSITVDNGKEFYKHKELAKIIGCQVYFADPYASWQRGANENYNGLIRQYIPRNCNFESLSDEYINLIENKLNNRPRKRFGFLSPFEYFNTNFKN